MLRLQCDECDDSDSTFATKAASLLCTLSANLVGIQRTTKEYKQQEIILGPFEAVC